MQRKSPVVLITGCSSGIGAALAREFHSRHCTVVATARRLESLAELAAEGIDARQLDVNQQEDIDRVVTGTLETCGRIDIVINNAGYALIAPSIDLSATEFRAQLETNLVAPLWVAQAVAPAMKNNGRGKIINIGSISGIVTTPFSGAYCASKAALHSLSDALRMELSPFGIEVITVQPGAIESKFGENASRTAGNDLKEGSWYKPLEQAIQDRAKLSQQGATPTQDFARSVVDLALGNRTADVIRLGKKSWFLPAMKRLLPVRTLDRILIRKFGLNTVSDR